MKIFLIGMPASGKSTLGSALARQLKLPFVDTDLQIVTQQGLTVDEIFSRYGEDYFRDLEKEILDQHIKGTVAVISTGGGLPCFNNNIDLMNFHGLSIFLDVPIKVLINRMLKENGRGHMVRGKTREQLAEFMLERYNQRREVYSKAHIRISHSNITLQMILGEIENHPTGKSFLA